MKKTKTINSKLQVLDLEENELQVLGSQTERVWGGTKYYISTNPGSLMYSLGIYMYVEGEEYW